MTKKETNKAITRLTQKLRVLAGYNPDLLTNAALYFHGFKTNPLPPGFVFDHNQSACKVYKFVDPDGVFTITAFMDEFRF